MRALSCSKPASDVGDNGEACNCFFLFPIAILISRATSDANGNSECYALAILGNNEIVEKLCLSFPSWYVKWQWHGTCRLKRSIIICDSFGR